jgi:hypothetical protein
MEKEFDLKKFTGEGKPIPMPGWLSVTFLIFLITFFSFGFYSLLDVYEKYSNFISKGLEKSSPILAQILSHKFALVLILIISIIFSLVLSLLLLKIFRDYSEVLIKFTIASYVIFSIMMISMGIIFTEGYISFLVVGLLLISLVYIGVKYFRQPIDRTAKFLRTVSQVILEEKELLLPPLVLVFIGTLVFFSFGGILLKLISSGFLVLDAKNPVVIITFIIMSSIFGFLLAVFTYSLLGINVAIVYIWYRGVDPKLKDGVHTVLYQLPNILVFGLYSALVYAIEAIVYSVGRKDNESSTAADIANEIIDRIWGTINYFTLPAIIIENLPTKVAIKRSIYMLVKYLPDVVVKESLVRSTIDIMSLPLFLICGAIGFVFSWLFLPHTFLWILFGTLFVLLATWIPILIVLFSLDIDYKTILYAWALDEEAKKEPPYKRLGAIAEEISIILKLRDDLKAKGKLPSKEEIEKAREEFEKSYKKYKKFK